MIAKTSANQPAPRRIEEIEKQLADVAKLKREAESHGTPDFASQTALESLCRHERELLEELHAAKRLRSSTDPAEAEECAR